MMSLAMREPSNVGSRVESRVGATRPTQIEASAPVESAGRRRILRSAALVAVAVALVAFFASGAHRAIDLEGLRSAIRAAGPLGALVFLCAFALLQPLHVSSYVFIFAAAFVWPPPLAFALSWAGAFAACHVSFGVARGLGQGFVQPRLPERFRRFDRSLSAGGLRFVVLTKLVFFSTPAVQFAFGVSRIPLRTFALGTAIANTPTVALAVVFAAQLERWLLH
jgi:uncharacterized membrane protein YdjX (TVP38/TMEM64 family)